MGITRTGRRQAAGASNHPARKSRPQARGVSGNGGGNRQQGTAVGGDELRSRIEFAAYLRAESRGFANGSPEQDWFEAENELRRGLGQAGESGQQAGQ